MKKPVRFRLDGAVQEVFVDTADPARDVTRRPENQRGQSQLIRIRISLEFSFIKCL